MNTVIIVLLGIGSAVVGAVIGWVFAQRALNTARERAGNAEGQVVSMQRQLDTAVNELAQARRSLQDQEGHLSRAQAERDNAFQQSKAASDAQRSAEENQGNLNQRLANADKLVVEKDGMLEVARGQVRHFQEQVTERQSQILKLENQLQQIRDESRALQEERVSLQATVSSLQTLGTRKDQELATQKQWIEEQTRHLQTLFAKTAGELLEDKATKFGQANKHQIEALMKPFQEQLSDFRKRVDELHTAETGARAKLEQQIATLAQKAAEVGTTANTLAAAMLGNAKKQGNWGELQLKVLLEQAGFVEGKHFDTQVGAVGDDNEQRFADTVLWLPEKECLVIDAKLTLPSWVEYCSTDNVEARNAALTAIVASLRNHYQALAGKEYAQIISKGRSVPFTLMFIPIEAAGIEAFRAAPDLFTEAQKRKIIMVTPTTLFTVLHLVSALWNIHDRQTNSLKIAEEGRLLLRKLGTFVQSFRSVGDSLTGALNSYEAANNQLQQGRGNLITIAERMTKLGVESPKGGELARLIELSDGTAEESSSSALVEEVATGSENPA